ncbi:MAG: GNAT family N-acetyltransferase [Deinococcales bacterium]|jgi:ribosomal protein S18 acetylase RimI-like enzyme
MVHYRDSAEGITPDQLRGFFEGWPYPPTPGTHLRILTGSDAIALALTDTPAPRVVGFATAITDGVLAASIPLLEVLPEYRGRGIGRELVERLLARLDHLYMIDVTCDPDVVPFYTSLGMQASTGASLRDYARQAGARAR